jgi:hypothetical protein
LWQVFQNRLQTAQQLKARNWKGSIECALCGLMEDIDHLLFKCPLAEFIWAFLKETLGWNGQPRIINDLTSIWLRRGFGVDYQAGLACFTGFCWAIWITRNKICIQKTFPSASTDVIYLGIAFIQEWKLLMKEVVRQKMEDLVGRVLIKLKEFKPLDSHPSDVGFI